MPRALIAGLATLATILLAVAVERSGVIDGMAAAQPPPENYSSKYSVIEAARLGQHRFPSLGAQKLAVEPVSHRASDWRGAVVFDENFATPDGGWPNEDNVLITRNGLTVRPPVNGSTWAVNHKYSMDGNDFVVSAIMPSPMPSPANEDTVGGVGVVFWHHDGDNYYIAFITPDEFAWISRRISGKWTTLVDKISTSAINTASGMTNNIEVAIKGNSGIFVVNDTKVTDFHGQPPTDSGGGPPGVYAESGPTITTWVFPRMQMFSYTP